MFKKTMVVLAVALTVGIPSATASTPDSAGSEAPGFPTFMTLPADQAAHPQAANEWWYTVGHIFSGGHEYGYEVVLTKTLTQFAITDVTAGTFISHQYRNEPGDVSASPTELDVRTPAGTLSGPMNAMHLTASLPQDQGRIDVTLNARGPVLYNNGTGLYPFLGGASYYYSLPNAETSGTLTIAGRTTRVTGRSWMDHQWGDWDWTRLTKWTWMGIQLDNGENLDLWDIFDSQGEGRWATVLHRDGSHRLVTVEPLAKHATDFQTSPVTGQRYAGKWTVEIPSLHTTLTVTARPVLQELHAEESFTQGVNNAAAAVRGTYQGRPVTGKAYVEQLGAWR
jgi:predicted secreted hydrolase